MVCYPLSVSGISLFIGIFLSFSKIISKISPEIISPDIRRLFDRVTTLERSQKQPALEDYCNIFLPPPPPENEEDAIEYALDPRLEEDAAFNFSSIETRK